jgi:hypothetical protein
MLGVTPHFLRIGRSMSILRGQRVSRRGVLAAAASTGAVAALGVSPGMASAAVPATLPHRPTEPDFGPNVFVFDPATPAAEIQAKFDAILAIQEHNEMGLERYAFLLKPGAYDLVAKIGYYTSIAGLGASPDDVAITGAVSVGPQPDPNGPSGITALTNFWRSAENLSVTPTDWSNQWAVSQAAPMRRVHIKGILWLEPGGGAYSSGGYLADSKVDGITINGSQQQWLTRDSVLGDIWTNGVWNQVFSGVVGAPEADYPTNPYTVLPASPVTREKPYLTIDADGQYQVFVPALRHNTSGTSWGDGKVEQGTALSIDTFFIAKPSHSAREINEALLCGKNLLLTPGVYRLDRAIWVTRANTVVLGLGMPSLTTDSGDAVLRVADVDGVRIAGVLVDAGKESSPTLVEIGSAFSRRDHSANPISLQDVFVRIGGPWAGKAAVSITVNANDTLIDNIWAWRADHGQGVGWDINTAATGVIINGDDVTAYGLFVEHYQKYQTVWTGERGRTIFYQSELPYDPPSQIAWSHAGINGWASYKVGPRVHTHEAWGMGVYCFFNQNVDIREETAIEVPEKSGVVLHDMVTVFLNGSGGIEHTINDVGTPLLGEFGTSNVVRYPAS